MVETKILSTRKIADKNEEFETRNGALQPESGTRFVDKY